MRPLQKFRSAEDEEEQKIYRTPQSLIEKPIDLSTLTRTLFFLATCFYGYLFIESLQGRWFDPRWTTDDSLQQAFMFHEVTAPGVFVNDMITDMMVNYLSPIHLWLGTAITYFTQDPMMTGHWIMLIQVGLAVGFLFAAVKQAAGFIPACASVIWLLHTRNIMQRLTAGLQRGWAPALLAAYIYFLYKQNHKAIYFLIGVSWLLHAPSALLISASYGLFLLWKFIQLETRRDFSKTFVTYLLLCPLFALLAFYGTKKPEYLGDMVTYEVAANMPEFSSVNGRFKMTPLWPRWTEISQFGFQAFNTSLTKSSELVESYTPHVAILLLVSLLAIVRRKKEKFQISEIVTFLLAILLTYEASRLFAFKLFVPQRYIQIPMAIFFIAFIPILVWRMHVNAKDIKFKRSIRGVLGLLVVGLFVYAGSGSGLTGDANFNMPRYIRGDLWNWVSATLPQDAIIAGHPAHIDGVQLFGKRQGYVTNETAHPFYDKYYQEMSRRLDISLRAHYSRDLSEIVTLLEPEGISYFIFKRKAFYPDALSKVTYFSPFDTLVKELASHPAEEYAYKKLPKEVDLERYPFLIYRDDQSAVVDIKKLQEFLSKS